MLSILDSFEKRLQALEQSVLPLYEQTARLQRKQTSRLNVMNSYVRGGEVDLQSSFKIIAGRCADIGKVQRALETTLSYYQVANEMDLNLKDAECVLLFYYVAIKLP